MQRMCFALDLRDDPEAIESYKRWHAPGGPPAGVNASLRDAGISLLEIYLTGNRLFMIMEVEPHYSAEAKAKSDATNADVQNWNKLMATLQQALPWAAPGELWTQMPRIYSLAEQPS